MRKLILFTATVALALGAAAPALAGGGGYGGSVCPGFADGTEIVMLDSCFAGTAHFAPTNGEVTVVNKGEFPHTYTAIDGTFDSGVLQPGQSFTFSTKAAALTEVFCTLHGTRQGDGMAGLLVVGDPAVPTVAVAPPATPTARPPGAGANAELIAALDRQSEAVAELTAQEAALLARLVTSETQPTGWPAPLTVVLVVAALAVAAIFAVTRAPSRAGTMQQVGEPETV